MDKFLSGIRALFDQPSRPTGTRVDPISIARRAPDLIKRLLDGSPIDGEELTRLTKNLTPAQKRSVKSNTDSFRRYFRLARRARIVPAAVGMGGGVATGLGAATITYPMVRKFLPGVAEADSLRQEQDDLLQLQRIIQGPSVLTEAAEEFTDRRQRPVRPKQRGSYRESADEIREDFQRRAQKAREEDFQRRVRATQGAIQPVAPSRLQTDTRSLSDVALPGVSGVPDSVAAVDSLLSPELDMSIDSGLPFGLPDDLPDLVEIIAEETESPADQLKKIISTLELSGPALRQPSFVPTDTIRVPKITPRRQSSAMRADRAKPRRRLQPTAPGIFGELLDESTTDFQGAPMMSEREILRMIRGE